MTAIYTSYAPKADDGDCGICRDPLENGNAVVAHGGDGAKHPLHLECVKASAIYSRTEACPVCRTPTDMNSLLNKQEKLDCLKIKCINELKYMVKDGLFMTAMTGSALFCVFAGQLTGLYLLVPFKEVLERNTWFGLSLTLGTSIGVGAAFKVSRSAIFALESGFLTLEYMAQTHGITYLPEIVGRIKIETAILTTGMLLFIAEIIMIFDYDYKFVASPLVIAVTVGFVVRKFFNLDYFPVHH